MLHKILISLFQFLLFFTPLFWLPLTSELFEFNKMMLVYLLTTLITTVWMLKILHQKQLIFKRTPLDIPILLFLMSQILSTIFSIDQHLSIWGYYSRQNGGLLSIVAYLLLFYAFVSNLSRDDVHKLLKTAILGGVAVSIWAIPEHFGASPSCLLLTGSLDTNCWSQDVQARVFATLGQPNWLASYLAILIYPSIYFLLTAVSKKSLLLNFTYVILLYLAFTFTYSRGATLGLIAGLGVFVSFWFIQNLRNNFKLTSTPVITLLLVLILLLMINLIFGSALTSFTLFTKNSAPTRESISESFNKPSVGTQLENGGTESGVIRLIVWKGAVDIFKYYPLTGSGVETFAYAYYQFRPIEHNLVSEWDYLYNKAHNEYLNYLSTTGALGLISYLSLILIFIMWSVRQITKRPYTSYTLLQISLLSSYVSYLVSNFFGFSVVNTALLFFLIPSLVFTITPKSLTPVPVNFFHNTKKIIASMVVLLLISVIILYNLFGWWVADHLYAKSSKQIDSGDIVLAYNNLVTAVYLNPFEPLYLSELSFAAANSAVALEAEESTASSQMKDISASITARLLITHPHNTTLFRNATRTYYTLSLIDPTFIQKTLQVIDQGIDLAPTDPKLLYNKALVLGSMQRFDEAKELLIKALQLKPNYKEAQDLLEEYLRTKL